MGFRKILVPVDFSEFAGAALRSATSLAEATGAELQVIHVTAPLVPGGTPVLPAAVPVGNLKKVGQESLSRFLEPFEGKTGIALEGHVREGSPRDEIISACSDVGADLIVMGTHGRSGLERALMGSVAERVVRSSHVPVLAVHEHHEAGTKDATRALAAVDLSESTGEVLAVADRISVAWRLPLDVAHAVEAPELPPEIALRVVAISRPKTLEDVACAEAQKRLEKVLDDQTWQNRDVGAKVVPGRPRDAIVGLTETGPYHVVVLGTHGRSGFRRLVMGSVAEGIMRRARCAVLVVPPSSRAEEHAGGPRAIGIA